MLYRLDDEDVELRQKAIGVYLGPFGYSAEDDGLVQRLEALQDDLNYPVTTSELGLIDIGITLTQQRILGEAIQVGRDVLKEQQARFSGGDISRSYAQARLRILREVCDRLFQERSTYEQDQLLSHLRNDTSALLRGLDQVGMSKKAALRAAHKELKDALGKIEEVCEGTDILTTRSLFD